MNGLAVNGFRERIERIGCQRISGADLTDWRSTDLGSGLNGLAVNGFGERIERIGGGPFCL
ncbi:MAG: hypothetical protein ACPGWR_02875 [Ardenticatenaceae bacterium]